MDADHIFFLAIEDVPETVGQFFQKLLVKGLAGPGSQSFEFLHAPAGRNQTTLPSRFRSANQVTAVTLLRFPHVV